MPYVPMRLKALKLKGYPDNPTTLGEHLKKKRKELGLTRREAGIRMGASARTVFEIEYGRRSMPSMPIYSKVIAFIGYYPYPITTIGERLLMLRRKHGWTLKQAARVIGCNCEAWRHWEKDQPIRYSAHRMLVAKLLGLSEYEVLGRAD